MMNIDAAMIVILVKIVLNRGEITHGQVFNNEDHNTTNFSIGTNDIFRVEKVISCENESR